MLKTKNHLRERCQLRDLGGWKKEKSSFSTVKIPLSRRNAHQGRRTVRVTVITNFHPGSGLVSVRMHDASVS